MKEIKTNIIIASALVQSNKNIISIQEIMEYAKDILLRLKRTKYSADNIKERNIFEFFRFYSYFGKIVDSNIILNSKINIKERITKYFLSDLDKELILLLKRNEKFIFPIIYKNRIISFYFISNNNFLSNIKKEFYYDEVKNENYILDLDIIMNKYKYMSLDMFLDEILLNEKFIKKEVFNCDSINNFINSIDEINNNKLKKYFELTSEVEKLNLISKNLSKYLMVAKNNDKILSNEYKILVKKLNNLT